MPDYTPINFQNSPSTATPINATRLNQMDLQIDANEQAIREGGVKKVRLASTANLTLSGTQTIDGVAAVAGNRVLVKNQSTGSQNGIWVVGAAGWTRADDADAAAEFGGGTLIEVAEGTANGGKVFRCTNSTAVTIGSTALTFAEVGATGGSTAYLTDGTTPLKFSAFLAAASGNGTTAFQNAINILFSSAAYNLSLDLEGATVTLVSPVTIPTTHTGGIKSIVNGEILADPSFSGGDHMIRCQSVNNLYNMRMVNVTMNGSNVASWVYWDIGNWIFQACQFKNNKAGTAGDNGRLGTGYNRAGLFCSDSGVATGDAGFWINNCWFACDDGPTAPSSRQRWGIVSQTGDNKISGGTTMSYFRHSLIQEGPGSIISNFHPFQGQTQLSGAPMTSHTAVIKFTNGRCGAQVSGLYLGKGFMEISNESNTGQGDIGEIVITNMRAYMDNGVANEAHIQARDYGAGSARVSDISITNSYFLNGGSIQTQATKLFNPANFVKTDYHGIHMSGNTFDSNAATDAWEVAPQANPCTLRVNLSSATNQSVSFSGYLPFAGNPQMILDLIARGGSSQVFRDTTVGNTNNATFTSSASYSGDVQITATCNVAESGFVNG